MMGGSTSRTQRVAFPVGAFLSSRTLIFLTAYVLSLGQAEVSLRGIFSMWDGGWCLSVIEEGYPTAIPEGSGDEATTSIVFFPAYPLVARCVSLISSLPFDLAAILTSLAAGTAAALLIWTLTHHLFDVETADRTVVLFSFFPSSFVLSMVYSEALFLLFASAALLWLLEDRWLPAGLAAAAAAATRPPGIALV